MADYKKMYAILCGAVDGVIDPLSQIPEASVYARLLCDALGKAEAIYLNSEPSVHLFRDPSALEKQ